MVKRSLFRHSGIDLYRIGLIFIIIFVLLAEGDLALGVIPEPLDVFPVLDEYKQTDHQCNNKIGGTGNWWIKR